VTAPEQVLARLRSVVPETWDPALAGPELTVQRLDQIRQLLYPAEKVRARILKYLAEHGASRAGQMGADLGLSNGSVSGHLHGLVAQGRAERPWRGIYCLPGQAPAVMPPASPAYHRAALARHARRRPGQPAC
jgi:hypothetical protein